MFIDQVMKRINVAKLWKRGGTAIVVTVMAVNHLRVLVVWVRQLMVDMMVAFGGCLAAIRSVF